MHLLPALDGNTTADDGGLALGRYEAHLVAVLAAQRLVDHEWLGEVVGTTVQAHLHIALLAVGGLTQRFNRLVEGRGRSLDDLLCREIANRKAHAAKQQK